MNKNWKKSTIGLLFAVLILSMQTVPVHAASSGKTVRVACGINNALYLDDNGIPVGYCSEYLKQLAKINHWHLEYVEASWNDSVQNLYDGKIDLLLPTQMTADRKSKMGFSTAIGGYQPIGLFAAADSTLCYGDYVGFDGTRIAVSKGTSNEEALATYAAQNGFSYTPVYLNTVDEKVQALKDGSVDLIVFSTLNDVVDGKVVAMLDYLPFYYCTRIDDTAFLQELNHGMNEILIRNPELVQQVFYDFMNKNISFAYTREEQTEINKKGTVIIGIYQDTPPLFDVDENESYTGIYVDLIQRIKELSGLDIEIKALNRKELAFDYLDEGVIDFVMGSSDQALKYISGENYAQSEGMMDYYTVGITLPEFSKSKTDHLVFALTNGRKYWAPTLSKRCPNSTFQYYETSKECLKAIEEKRADVTLLNSWEYNYQSKNPRFQSLMEWENTRVLSKTVFISKNSENKLIRSVLDKSIEQISNEEKEAFITTNLNKPYNSYEWQDNFFAMKQTLFVFGCILFAVICVFTMYIVMRRKSMRQLQEQNQLLEEANDSKTKFLSRMSHELRTPLNAITGYASVIEQSAAAHDLNEKNIKSNIEAILRAAKYQLSIIGDLLDIQKIESGKIELTQTEVDFAKYMEDLLEMIKPEADEKHIHFSYERLSVVSAAYLMDGVRFQQVLLNILHNAMKFTPNGGTVKLTWEVIDRDEKTNTMKFVISDTGIGMSEDFQKNYLFHRFAQEYQGNTSPYEGCGIGLAISKELIHLMGGEITCTSALGIGSTFTVIITVQHINKRRRSRKQRVLPSYDLAGIRVLLCEDNPMNQDMERRLLERMKCEVDIADDGQRGLEAFKQSGTGHYHVILMDIRMPNMDGLECTRAIRALDRPDAKTVPILAVSANAFEEDVQRSLEAGMNEHLAKPVDVRIFYQTISKYCKEHPTQ